MPTSRVSFAAVAHLVVTAEIALAQVIPLGREFQVNTRTLQSQYDTAIAAESNGDFVVTWDSQVHDGAVTGIVARRYSSAGAALGGEFLVNAFTLYGQDLPSVAVDGDGDFVVVWTSYGQDGSFVGVFGRRFSSSGTALGNEFQVNVFTMSIQSLPAVSMDAEGDFVVAWSSPDSSMSGVFARRFASSGTALGGEMQVNVYATGSQSYPAVAADADGDFVVAWMSNGQDGASVGVFARRFASSGGALGGEFQVNTYTLSYQENPSVSAGADGSFVVAWASNHDGGGEGIFARRFSSAGTALAVEFEVNSYTTYSQGLPSVASAADGDFVVAWQTNGQEGGNVHEPRHRR